MNNTPPQAPTPEPKWLMPVVDVVLVFVAFILAYLLRYNLQIIRPIADPARADLLPYLPYALGYGIMLYLNYSGNDLYKPIRGRDLSAEVTIIINGVTIATVILLAVFFLVQPLVTSRLMLVYVAGLTIALLTAARVARRIVLARYRARGIGVQRVLIVGMGETGKSVLGTMISREDYAFKVMGYVDDEPPRVPSANGQGDDDTRQRLGRVPYLGQPEALEDRLVVDRPDLVVITLPWEQYRRVLALTRLCQKHGVEVRLVPDIVQLNMRRVTVENLDGIPLMGISEDQPFRPTSRLYKRVLDMALIVLAFPVWGPLMLAVAAAIKIESGGSVFYVQTRLGENGKPFRMIKFRSMVPNADAMRDALLKQYAGVDPRHPKIEDDPRITRIGRFIRRTSLDELPNLFNVIKGEMSLVGPRPPTPDEVTLYQDWHRRRLKALPGMTGLWQVSGRSDIPFDEMCLMDIYYIENWTLAFDIQLLLMTIPRVLMRRGAY
jgi:exopolysaccharide biosynthesis polyprenyl glycosylphosphotransferase